MHGIHAVVSCNEPAVSYVTRYCRYKCIYFFLVPYRKGICQDTNKPLMIPHGGDSYEQIWPGNSPAQFSLDFFKHLFESKIAKFNEKSAMPEDPAVDPNFKENEIDELRNRIMDEIILTERVRQEFSTADNYII